MKAFINKTAVLLALAGCLAACSPDAPATQEEKVEVQVVEEITPEAPLPPAQKPGAQDAPKEEIKTHSPAAPQTATKAASHTYTADELMGKLKKWEQNISTFQAGFNQVSSYDGVEINRSKGRLYYDFPAGLIRWEMRTKEDAIDQVGITNKKEIVILDDSLRPVTTLAWKDWQKGQPNQAIFDIGNYAQLADRHRVEVSAQDDEKAVLALTPTAGTEKYTLFITLSKKDFFPMAVALQAEDMLTTNELISVRKNEPLAADLFGGFFK